MPRRDGPSIPVYGVRAIWRSEAHDLERVALQVFGNVQTEAIGAGNNRAAPVYVVCHSVRACEALCAAARSRGVLCMGWDIRRQIPVALDSCRRLPS